MYAYIYIYMYNLPLKKLNPTVSRFLFAPYYPKQFRLKTRKIYRACNYSAIYYIVPRSHFVRNLFSKICIRTPPVGLRILV